jgi:SAM-dependent methyltransferase
MRTIVKRMPAIPQEGTSSPSSEVDQSAQTFRYFTGDGALYERSRPAYPEALITRIVSVMPGREILDVGCGTGIEARQFQAAGCTVLGVDPDAQMAQYARSTGIPVEVAAFETWAADSRTFDAVVAGTAWHCMDPVVAAVKAAQMLRPGGLLAPFHHASHAPPELDAAVGMTAPSWASSRSAPAYRQAAADFRFDLAGRSGSAMDLYQPLFDTMASGIRTAGEFSEPEQWQFEWERTYPRDEWLSVLSTRSAVIKLAPDKRAEVLDSVRKLIDGMGGSFRMRYTTVAVTAVRTRTS